MWFQKEHGHAIRDNRIWCIPLSFDQKDTRITPRENYTVTFGPRGERIIDDIICGPGDGTRTKPAVKK